MEKVYCRSRYFLYAIFFVLFTVWTTEFCNHSSCRVWAFSRQTENKSRDTELLVGIHSADQNITDWPKDVLRVKRIPGGPVYRIWVPEDQVEMVRAALQKRSAVVYVEKADVLYVPEKLGFGIEEESLKVDSTSKPRNWLQDIHAHDLFALGSGDGVVVAVIDTGLDLENARLSSQVWINSNEQPGNGIDDDGNGYVDDRRGWDFGEDDNYVQDSQGHGTLVSFIVQALASEASLMPLKVNQRQKNSFSTGDVVEALYYAVQAKADVINLSFSGSEYSLSLDRAVQDAYESGSVVIAAAGNSGQNVEFPAFQHETIAVGALNADGERAGFSNFGCELDLLAPGVDVLACGLNQDWFYVSGTSFSTAMVSGTAALVASMNPHLGPDSVCWMLQGESPFSRRSSFLSCLLPVPRLNGREVLTAALPQPELTELSALFPDSPNLVRLNVNLPPTETPTHFYFGLHQNGEWLWLTRSHGLRRASSEKVPGLCPLPAKKKGSSIPIFGPDGLFPSLNREELCARSFKLLLALTDCDGRVITPLVVTNLNPQTWWGAH